MLSTSTLPQPLDLTEFERTLLEQAAGHYTDYHIRITGVETLSHALFLSNALEILINSNLEDDNNIVVYAALLGRVNDWLVKNFPLEGEA